MYEEFSPDAWAALGRNGRVAFRLDSAYYLETLREKRADEEWRRDHPERGHDVPRQPRRMV